MKVLNEYPGSHHYWTKFNKTEYFCPKCGAQDLWEEQGPGDYYQGAEYLCIKCHYYCYLDMLSKGETPNYIEIIEQIKTGITKEPTTRPGY